MRIRVIQEPTRTSIDGIRLNQFEVGRLYDVSTSLGTVFLVEKWGEFVGSNPTDVSDAGSPTATAHGIPGDPPNLKRERYPPLLDRLHGTAQDFRRRGRSRR
jgi:hypothetical protein